MRHEKTLLPIIILTAVLTAVSYFTFAQKQKFDAAAIILGSETDVVLSSPYNGNQIYDESFAKLDADAEKTSAVAAIVSHHLLAKDAIAQLYNEISPQGIQTIFLVSPDHYGHFYASGTLAYTSKAAWDTPYGRIETNKENINSLLESGLVENATSSLGLEHGIYTEIPFIKKFFPDAKLVPLVLDSNSNYKDFAKLGEMLKGLGNQNSIFIVSSDFSHETTAAKNFVNDSKSIDELKNISNANLKNITNDCQQCLVALQSYLNNENYKFNLTSNQNSFDISGEDPESVTSYVFGYFLPKTYTQILFTGDLMFDRGIRQYASKNGSNEFIFQKVRSLLENQDLVVSNLEGPITGNDSISLGTVPASANNYTFTFDPSVAKTLYQENIKLVSLGNNHILNFYTAGLLATKKYLNDAGIEYFGAPDGPKSIIKTIDGFKIAFVNYNEFSGSAALDQSQTISEIQKLKSESDLIIVYCHWDVEYKTEPTEATKELAHQFINAGADLIIGSHPHVVQSTETYNSKKIYYSLGNFVFDQYFSPDVRNGLGVILKIDPKTKNMQFEEVNLYLQSGGQTVTK